MNGATTETVKHSDQHQVHRIGTSERPPSTAPTLESIVHAICLDANYDSLKFVLRSDTGHDGE
jgi:hypothetical protein